MNNYGLTPFQREQALNKLHKNIEFMHTNGIQLDDKIVTYADFVQNSYMNSNRYIAEIQHRAWNMYAYARERNLANLMLTLTLPSRWHSHKTNKKGKLVPNPKYAGRPVITKIGQYNIINAHVIVKPPLIEPYLDFSKTIDYYTPRNASKELSRLFKKLFDDRSYKDIDKDDRCYFRVTEPHKDGTPHIHMSLFVPFDRVERIEKAFKRKFPQPQGKIEKDIRKPVNYLMKYVLKTFDDLRKEQNISNLTLWYLHHGISRFYTSKTFINLEVYRKLKGEYNLCELTDAYREGRINVYYYKGTDKLALIENEYGTLYTPKPINYFEKHDTQTEVHYNSLFVQQPKISIDELKKSKSVLSITPADVFEHSPVDFQSRFESIYKRKPLDKPIEVYFDNEPYTYYKGRFTKVVKQPYQMSDFELYQYYQSIDIDTIDYKRFLNTRNECIKRKLIDGEIMPLDTRVA